MIRDQRVLAMVPARGGSKSVPDKNIRSVGGKPLIAWSIEMARLSTYVDRVIVSTDSAKISEVAVRYGAEVVGRPAHLATDSAIVVDAIRHLIQHVRAHGEHVDILVLLEPTCPLRTSADIDSCLELLTDPKKRLDSVATFKHADLNPHRAWKIQDGYPTVFVEGAIPWKPRQQLPEAFQLNGAVYAFFCDRLPSDSISLLFGAMGAVMMPDERSVDIDNALDFTIVEAVMQANG